MTLAERFPPDERRSAGWAGAWFFCLLFGYYQLRPLRETKGFASGSDEIPMLFLASFMVMLLAVPIYGLAVSRSIRHGGGILFVRRAYRLFQLTMIAFFAFMQWQNEGVSAWVGRVYFVWLSVYNQFAVMMMWGIFTAALRSDQAKRWFGLISAGGTLGGIFGSITARTLSSWMDISWVLVGGAVFLELCLICSTRFSRSVSVPNLALNVATKTRSTWSDAWSGLQTIAKSPYLLGIASFLLAIKACATTVYCQQGDWIAAAGLDQAERFKLLADINTWVLGSTLVVQSLGTAALMRRLSMAWVLLLGPLIYLIGFILLATYPSLSLVVVFVVVHRAASYALIAPAVEVLYTVVPKSDLFRIKGILDTVVIRGGDVMSAQLYGGLRMLSLSLPAIAWLFVPIAGGTCLIAAWSGRQQTKQADVNSSRVM